MAEGTAKERTVGGQSFCRHLSVLHDLFRVPSVRSKCLANYARQLQALKLISAALEKAGTSLQNAIKVTVYLTSLENYGLMNEVYDEIFTWDPKPVSIIPGFVRPSCLGFSSNLTPPLQRRDPLSLFRLFRSVRMLRLKWWRLWIVRIWDSLPCPTFVSWVATEPLRS